MGVRDQYARTALLMSEFIEALVENDPGLLGKSEDIYLNIDEM